MKCPHCGSMQTRVLDSRFSTSTNAIRRRRICTECEKRFTSYEVSNLDSFKESLRQEIIGKVMKSLDFRTAVIDSINEAFDKYSL